MVATLKDIAEETGYTIATVSRALNSSNLVREKTREKILKTAHEMGYVCNGIARGLVTRCIPTVGIIIPDITNPYFPALVKGVQDTMMSAGYNTVLCNSDGIHENEEKLMRMLCEFRVKGIIMDPLHDNTYNCLREISVDMPVIFAGNRPFEDNVNLVIIDNYKGAVKATKYLIGLGHKRIAFIGESEQKYVCRCRIEGYKDTMIKWFNNINSSLITTCSPDRHGGYCAANGFIQEGNTPTAFIAGSDVIALGIMECFSDLGFRIPQDVSIIGFDDIEYASLPSINLTTIAEPRYEIGKMAAKIMLDIFDEKVNSEPKQIILDPELIVRKTCSKLND